MNTYIMLGHFTAQGMDKIRGSPTRIDTARHVMDTLGASLKHWYVTMGAYDFVALVEAPDDETVAKLALSIGSHGNIRTETLRAFTEPEYREIVATLRE